MMSYQGEKNHLQVTSALTNKDFSSRVVHPNTLQDGSSIICHLDACVVGAL